MGKCNLIAPPVNPAGNFILFSQYADDLTKQNQSKDFYRVTPSRYVLMNIGATGFDNKKFAEYMQNYYENSCSVARDKDSNFNPNYSRVLLWKALFNTEIVSEIVGDSGSQQLLSSPTDDPYGEGRPSDPGFKFSADVLYCGDIDITSTRQIDGLNYNEIYISVPQGAQIDLCPFTMYGNGSIEYPYDSDRISGYPDDKYPSATGWPSNRIEFDYAEPGYYADSKTGASQYTYSIFNSGDFDSSIGESHASPTVVPDSFSFNSVLVLYDVYKRNVSDSKDVEVYRDIPMGIYLTGDIDTETGIKNPVTIWRSNADIYGQGTSYGLRICTRYLSTQNQLQIVDSTISDTQDMYDQYAAVMGKIGDSQVMMDNAIAKMSEYQNNITSHLANIKNYTVNVPYIKEVAGKNYWFVNGKCLNVATTEPALRWSNY